MSIPAASLLMVTLLADAPEPRAKLSEPVQALVDHLGARTTDCPAGHLAPEVEDRAYCAATDLDFKRLRKSISKFDRKRPPAGVIQLDGWTELNGGLQATPLVAGSILLRLVFDPELSVIVLVPADGCMESGGDGEIMELHDRSEDGIENPERIAGGAPSYPERARIARIDGVVIIQAVVEKDGSLGERCVLLEQPTGYDFLESGLAALNHWRYKAAMRDGEPVAMTMTVAIEFDIP